MTLLLILLSIAKAESIVLYPGLSESLLSPAGQKIQVEKKGFVTLKDQGRKLLVIGKKTGSTHLKIGTHDYEIKILREGSYKTYKKLKEWQSKKLGPYVAIDKGELFVRGRLHTLWDWQDLANHMDSEDEFSLQTDVDAEVSKQIQSQLKEISNKNNIPFGVFNPSPSWEISLSSSEKQNISSYKKIFAPFGVQVNQSSNSLTSVPMIEVNILAAEVRRGEISKFGVNWPANAQVALVPKFGLDPNSVFVNVDLFEQHGLGKVLASPTLLAQSGEEATFHSGGEFPIKSSNQFNASVTWKKYGIILKIKPKADFTGKMSIDIECEVSMIDPSSAIDGVPGLLMNRMSSHFNLSETKTIALSGLIKEEWGTSQQGLPGFKSIPIFSQLFSSTHYRNNQSELMFFVTPRIIK